MSNEMIFMITVLFYLGCVPVLYRLFGKTGLFAFSVFGTLLGNIAVCKTIDLFGISTTAGNVLYASTFLVTDILSNGNDFISPSLNTVFGLVPRISLASIAGYLLSQNIDVFLYHFLWEKSGSGRAKLWLRNNGSTLISQAVDTAVFTTLAFYGTYPTEVFLSILLSTYFFKAVVALLDTPFAYLSRMIRPVEG